MQKIKERFEFEWIAPMVLTHTILDSLEKWKGDRVMNNQYQNENQNKNQNRAQNQNENANKKENKNQNQNKNQNKAQSQNNNR